MNDSGWTIVLAYAFIVFGSVCALLASFERILGSSIPHFKFSPKVRRNRSFATVPIAMALLFSWTLFIMPHNQFCTHCLYPFVWKNPTRVMEASILAFGISGAVGWIVFVILLLVSSSIRLIVKVDPFVKTIFSLQFANVRRV